MDHWEWATAMAQRLGTTTSEVIRMAVNHGRVTLDGLVQQRRPSMPIADISDTAAALMAAGAEVRAQR